jgi:5-(carboxyamino)imidazole ribonucleotide mutase
MNASPLVGVVMGSKSDYDVLLPCIDLLREFAIPHETRIVSAHRTPDWLFQYAEEAEPRGLKILIAAAGGAAHLPGMLAAKTILPVLAVPVPSTCLQGIDSLLSIVQMPKGVPVATLAIGKPGAANAALLAVAILAGHDPGAGRPAALLALGPQPRGSGNGVAAVSVIVQGSTIGILGGGQLGRMTAMAARSMGYRVQVMDPDPSCPARFVVDACFVGSWDDAKAAADLARGCDVITLEIEQISLASLDAAARHAPVRPGRDLLAMVQDRIRQKNWLRDHGFPVGPYRAIYSEDDLRRRFRSWAAGFISSEPRAATTDGAR